MTRALTCLIVATMLIVAPPSASAHIVFSEGNEPIDASRFPNGTGAIINRTERIAWWHHADGGGHHAEGRGDVKVINEILAAFGKLDVKTRRIVVHDGAGQSVIGDRKKPRSGQIDWRFMVWSPSSWEDERKEPRWMYPIPLEETDAPSQIDIYTANIRWAEVIVPEGIEVIDRRLEPHGFTTEDGVVFEGHVKDSLTGKPIVATVRVQRIDIDWKREKQLYTDMDFATSNAEGKCVIKNVSPGPVRVVLDADGYAPRIVGHAIVNRPEWHSYDAGLMGSVAVSGRVTDEAGKPLADVDVRLEVSVDAGPKYESPTGNETKSNKDGRFRYHRTPAGGATVFLYKSGYLSGLGQKVKIPGDEIELRMRKDGSTGF